MSFLFFFAAFSLVAVEAVDGVFRILQRTLYLLELVGVVASGFIV